MLRPVKPHILASHALCICVGVLVCAFVHGCMCVHTCGRACAWCRSRPHHIRVSDISLECRLSMKHELFYCLLHSDHPPPKKNSVNLQQGRRSPIERGLGFALCITRRSVCCAPLSAAAMAALRRGHPVTTAGVHRKEACLLYLAALLNTRRIAALYSSRRQLSTSACRHDYIPLLD